VKNIIERHTNFVEDVHVPAEYISSRNISSWGTGIEVLQSVISLIGICRPVPI